MNANEREYLNRLAESVIGAAYEVSNTLGVGFLEKVYERALATECQFRGIRAVPQAPVSVVYKGEIVGEYFADILVEDALIVELKCADAFADEHLAQCLNYLRDRASSRIAIQFSKAESGMEAYCSRFLIIAQNQLLFYLRLFAFIRGFKLICRK